MTEQPTGPAPAFPQLFSPITIAGRTIRNRILLPSMHTGFANTDGTVSQRLLAYLEARVPGVGMMTLEQANIHPDVRRTSPYELDFWDDSFIPGVRQVADLAHRHGALAIVQISHPGRQTTAAVIGSQPVAPSVATCEKFPDPPRVLETWEIPPLQDSYVAGAERARRAGLDGVELHAAHGFLMCQFLSPCTNQRQDEYGGDTRRRARFVTDVIRRIRERTGPDFIIQLRLSVSEGVDGGLTIPESQKLAVLFEDAGLDVLHISAGMSFNRYLYAAPMGIEAGYNLPLAAAMKAVLSIPVVATGRLQDVRLAEKVLREGTADMIGMGRGLICDPQLPRKAERGDVDDIRLCISCNEGCGPRPITCMINPQAGYELERPVEMASTSRSVVVIGGGPAGLEAAHVAAMRGHRVHLYESTDHLGGQLALGAIPPGKAELMVWIRHIERQLRQMGVEILMGEAADSQAIAALSPDCVIVATGGMPLRPPIPGLESGAAVAAVDVLAGRSEAGQEVVVVGGGETGCETADYLASTGRRVTVVEMLPTLARDVVPEQRHYLFERLNAASVSLRPSTRVTGVSRNGVTVDGPEGPAELKADTVVLAVGVQSNGAIADEMRGVCGEVHVVGDAACSGNALNAIHHAFEVARII